MCLTGTNGFLGLGTNSPAMLLHVSNGGLLSTGTTGTNPNLGAGTRFMWIPDRGAVRFGTAFDDEWDHPNVGLRSVAGGYLVLASGESSIGLGSQIEITGNTAFGLGGELNVSGLASGAVGKTITVTGNASYAVGCAIENDADFNITIGQGLSFATRLTNSIEHSLMVGFNSDSPTLFVGGGDGTVGSSGNVGIGNITAPTHRLDVNGTARLRVMPNDTANVLLQAYSKMLSVTMN
jgi:hypothetical protein